MKQSDSAGALVGADSQTQLPQELTGGGRWLRLARWAWMVAAAIAFGVLIISIPAYIRGMETLRFIAPTIENPTTADHILNNVGAFASFTASLASLLLAVLLFWRRSHEWMALYVSFYLLAYGIGMTGPLETLDIYRPGFSIAVQTYVQSILIAAPTVILLCIFPTGRFVPGWTRWLALVSVISVPLVFFLPLDSQPTSGNPVALLAAVVWATMLFLALYAFIHRYRRVSGPTEKQQTKWVLFGFSAWFVSIVILTIPYLYLNNQPPGDQLPLWAKASSTAWWLSTMIIPVSLAIAIMRYRLWAIDNIINRTLVYGVLTACIIGIYVLIVGGLGTLFQTLSNLLIALIATGLVALIFQPLREWLQRAVNRLIYGERDDPATVLSSLGKRLEDSMAVEEVLPNLVETVAQTLKLPYVAIGLREGDEMQVAAEYGKPMPDLVEFPLIYQSKPIGYLYVTPRSPAEAFNPAEMRLLEDIARQAGAAVHSVQLTADLQRSRQRLVTAREEERRRLRRDLHDGLGPTLASHLLKIGSARALLDRDTSQAGKILDQLEGDLENTLIDIRRLVYNLRPPELDQLGLVGAIEQFVNQYNQAPGSASLEDEKDQLLEVKFEAPEKMPSLPAAVEVAAYRIVQEGLNNVVRHAGASNCLIRLSLNQDLVLAIDDDGIGLPANLQTGVGLNSMQERAAELGGTFTVTSLEGNGTKIVATLPGELPT